MEDSPELNDDSRVLVVLALLNGNIRSTKTPETTREIPEKMKVAVYVWVISHNNPIKHEK